MDPALAEQDAPQQSADEGDRHQDAQRAEPRGELEAAGRALVGADADQQRKQPERGGGGDDRVLERGSEV